MYKIAPGIKTPARRAAERLAVFILGCCTLLLLLEGGLRLLGFIYHRIAISQKAAATRGKFRILCIGDSFTFGYFALRRDQTYPSLLGKIFKTKGWGEDVEVINRGESGQNTYQILKRLSDNVESLKPDVVVLLAGGCNEWDLFGYYRYFHGKSLTSLENDFLYRVRIFKLIKLMHLFVLSSMDEFGKTDFRVFNQFPFTVQEIRKHNEAAPEGRREYEKGILLYERGDFAGAEKAMKQVVALNPRSVEGYIGLGLTQFRREKSNETLDSFLRAYELNAAETEEETGGLKGMKILKCLYLCCLANPGSRSAVSGKCRELFSRCPALKEELEIFLETVDRDAKKKIEAWIRSDIGQIINYCRQRDIAVVLQSYPRYPDFEASRIRQSLFREIAAEHGVPFVDQAEIFSRLSPIGKYFAPDNSHPNELGNQIMAENVYAAILPLLQSRR